MDEHRTYWEFNSDHARFGYMKRRIEMLERTQSQLIERLESLELEARGRQRRVTAEAAESLVRNNLMHRFYYGVDPAPDPVEAWTTDEVVIHDEFPALRMTPPEQEDDPW